MDSYSSIIHSEELSSYVRCSHIFNRDSSHSFLDDTKNKENQEKARPDHKKAASLKGFYDLDEWLSRHPKTAMVLLISMIVIVGLLYFGPWEANLIG